MAKMDFFKCWVAREGMTVTDVFENVSSFAIFDDGDDRVTIHYSEFGPGYPAVQDGFYEVVEGDEHIVASFSESRQIKLTFDRRGNGPPQLDRLNACVFEPAESPGALSLEQAGEWGAEADSGG